MDKHPTTAPSARHFLIRDVAAVASGRAPDRPSLIDRSPEARQARAEAARAALARMKEIHNGPEEDDGEFLRELDRANPGRFDLARYYADGPDPA